MAEQTPTPPKTAIALLYDGENAPRIAAKGLGETADAIMAAASAHGIPLHEDGELAALLARLQLGSEIPPPLYVAVAEVIAFAYIVLGKFPKGFGEERTTD